MGDDDRAEALTDRALWESIADDWLNEFCGPGQDPFGTEVNIPSFLDIVPPPSGLTLDVGCGEGRVARMLTERGHDVIGIDPVPRLVWAAARAGSTALLGDGSQLPIRAGSVKLAVSSMVLMDIDDLDAHLAEFGRVVASGGTLCVSVLHPINAAGLPLGDEHLTFALGDYLRARRHDWFTPRNGAEIHLRFWQRPISDYVNALDAAGFDLNQLREPVPPAQFVAEHDAAIWTRVPMFLHLRARRR